MKTILFNYVLPYLVPTLIGDSKAVLEHFANEGWTCPDNYICKIRKCFSTHIKCKNENLFKTFQEHKLVYQNRYRQHIGHGETKPPKCLCQPFYNFGISCKQWNKQKKIRHQSQEILDTSSLAIIVSVKLKRCRLRPKDHVPSCHCLIITSLFKYCERLIHTGNIHVQTSGTIRRWKSLFQNPKPLIYISSNPILF